jgi:hypothetical protein
MSMIILRDCSFVTACHCGEDNVYGTDEHGTIEFITDGERLWVEVENQENSLMAKH